jgi:hypothetical protein
MPLTASLLGSALSFQGYQTRLRPDRCELLKHDRGRAKFKPAPAKLP